MIYFISILSIVTLVYCCSMIYVNIGFYREQRGFIQPEAETKISLIIPVRDEAENILCCLKSIGSQNYNKSNFELIIINDHSSDKSLGIINLYLKSSDLDYSVYELTDKESKKEALKLGVKKSKYEVIATTDADCKLPSNWLKNIGANIKDNEMLLGPVMFKSDKGFLNKFQQLDMMAMQGLEFGTLNFGYPSLNNAANLAYKKESVKEVKGFDKYKTPSGDDVFLLEKFVENKMQIKGVLYKEHIVETVAEKEIQGFLNQRLRWASKAKFYTNKTLIYFSTIILLQNIISLLIYIALPLVENYSITLIILLLSKLVIDFILLLLVASFFEKKRALYYFIPVQLIYPLYILIVGVASITKSYNWKGRKY